MSSSIVGGGGGGGIDPSLMQEVRLFENSAERERVDNMAELYAVLISLEHLEKAFSRDYIQPKEYTAECSRVRWKICMKAKYELEVHFSC